MKEARLRPKPAGEELWPSMRRSSAHPHPRSCAPAASGRMDGGGSAPRSRQEPRTPPALAVHDRHARNMQKSTPDPIRTGPCREMHPLHAEGDTVRAAGQQLATFACVRTATAHGQRQTTAPSPSSTSSSRPLTIHNPPPTTDDRKRVDDRRAPGERARAVRPPASARSGPELSADGVRDDHRLLVPDAVSGRRCDRSRRSPAVRADRGLGLAARSAG